ncbi:MAG: phosphate signaling complex protein PhoU [Planctomycetota bacterium]|nr:phosphate signaling complex protein PhoU [Planctomycetota bacterium]
MESGGGIDERGSLGLPHNFEQRLALLKRRLVRESAQAIGMLEAALAALWTLDVDAARTVRNEDDKVDTEEVNIEREAHSLLALHHAFARDFRAITFILKVNADIERVADHASSIAKITVRIAKHLGDGEKLATQPPQWPTALRELGDRVPLMCHELMRAVLDENVDAARELMKGDQTIDTLDRRLFEEVLDLIEEAPDRRMLAAGMLIYRIGRELERVGDLMTNISEDVVYLATGSIVRHTEKKRLRSTGS